MIKGTTHLYFVAILPPKDQLEEMYEFKYYARDHFDSSKAYSSSLGIQLTENLSSLKLFRMIE